MEKIFRYVFFCTAFIILIISNAFPYTMSKITGWTSTTSSGYGSMSNNVYLEQYLTLENVNVTFSQDDNYYYFDVTANAYKNLYGIVDAEFAAMNRLPCPMLYKMEDFGNQMIINESCKVPYADARTGTFHSSSTVMIKRNTVSDYLYKYHKAGDSSVFDEAHSNWNGDRYFIPNALRNNITRNDILFRYCTTYPDQCINNGEGVVLARNNSSSYPIYNGTKIVGYNANFDVKVGIYKPYMDDYRYICFAETYVALDHSSVRTGSENHNGLSVCSNTIDLKEYAHCDHNWVYDITDKSGHKSYCENCKWEKNESHILIYEYDGIENNVCPCSYVDKVKYTFEINDDDLSAVTEVCDTHEDYEKHLFSKKTGYNFLWYEKYEKDYVNADNISTTSNALRTYFVATVSEPDEKAGDKSVIYKAKYTPIKYVFNYEKENNYDIEIDEEISPQVIYYDEETELKKNIDVRGYVFKGWTYDKGSNKIHLNPLQSIKNFTTCDLKEYTLYPVYERMDYTIVYNSGDYYFEDGTKEKTVTYNFFDTGNLVQIRLSSNDRIVNGYRDNNGNLYTKLSDVQKEIEKTGRTHEVIYLRVSVSSREVGSPERPKPGNGNVLEPTAERPKNIDDILSQTETTISELSETKTFEEETNYQYIFETAYDKKIIDDVKKNKKAVVEEEDDENDEESDDELSDGKIVATLSVANKWHKGIEKPNNLSFLLMIIRANKISFMFMMSILFVLLILYEILILKKYFDKQNEEMA